MDLKGGGLRPWFGSPRKVTLWLSARIVRRRQRLRVAGESLAAAAVVRRGVLAGPSRAAARDARPAGFVAAEAGRLGSAAAHHDGPAHRAAAAGRRRLRRGWPQPDHDGDERVGCGRTRVVAEPAGSSRRHRPDPRRSTTGPGAPGPGRRARAAVVPLGPDRQEPRRLRRTAASGNRRGHTRATQTRPARQPDPCQTERATASPEGGAQ